MSENNELTSPISDLPPGFDVIRPTIWPSIESNLGSLSSNMFSALILGALPSHKSSIKDVNNHNAKESCGNNKESVEMVTGVECVLLGGLCDLRRRRRRRALGGGVEVRGGRRRRIGRWESSRSSPKRLTHADLISWREEPTRTSLT